MAMSTPTYPTLPGGHALSPFRAQALLQKLQAIDDAIETLLKASLKASIGNPP